FESAVSQITSPGLNFSYADAAGNIAWWAAGMVPIRPPHVNSKHVLDGALGLDEHLGFVAFENNPKLINPEWGFIATANNMSTIYPVDAVPELRGYWQPTDRAGRIEEMVSAGSSWTIDDFKAMQMDDYGIAAPGVSEALLAVLETQTGEMNALEQEA